MINSIIIDDETKAIESLTNTIQKYCPELRILASGNSVDQAIQLIKQYNPDIIFLDVQMPQENGFALFQKLNNITAEIIFTTAHTQYALQAFRVSAFDFLQKPIDFRILQETLTKYNTKKKTQLNQQRIELLIQNISNNTNQFDKLVVSTFDTYHIINPSDILYCQADGAYTRFFLLNGDSHFASNNLGHYQDTLAPQTFYRIHKSNIVNLNHIKKYDKQNRQITLTTGTTLDVADREKKALLDKLSNKTEK
jgi:two-component system LytT family response regulator